MLDESGLGRLVDAVGYDSDTAVAVGVSSPSRTVLVARGDGLEDGSSVGYAGSLAKQFTGACAALLAQDGTFNVEAPVADWLGELPPWSRTIRVRHLIHHTAGLPSTEAVWEWLENAGATDWTSDGVLAALSAMHDVDPQPGAAYAYSNAGYICLARILERLVGEDLESFAKRQIFGPLQLRATTLWSGPAPSPPGAVPAQPPSEPAPLSIGDGGLWTCVRDLLCWNESLLADTLGVAGLLHTAGALDDGTQLDYAWGVRVYRVGGYRVESHGGSWDGATARLVRLPDLSLSFAALARDGSVDRMTALSSSLQEDLLGV